MEARKMEERESKVKDLVEKLQIGEITSKDGLKELGKRGLLESERWEIIPWAIYLILWIPFNFIFSDRLTRIHFPPIVIDISLAIGLLGMLLCMGITRMHCKRGGLNHDETVILLKEGPYRVMRHPAVVGMISPVLLPIILSAYVPFSFLSVAAIITMIVYSYCACLLEEKKLDIPKWGDEYLQYMKEVPRFNFIKGLWNLRKRKQ
jgi:protein-S-isoprenylcysteine O-methyltransferase Ste14